MEQIESAERRWGSRGADKWPILTPCFPPLFMADATAIDAPRSGTLCQTYGSASIAKLFYFKLAGTQPVTGTIQGAFGAVHSSAIARAICGAAIATPLVGTLAAALGNDHLFAHLGQCERFVTQDNSPAHATAVSRNKK